MKGLPKTKRCNSVAVTVSVRFRFGFGVYVKQPLYRLFLRFRPRIRFICERSAENEAMQFGGRYGFGSVSVRIRCICETALIKRVFKTSKIECLFSVNVGCSTSVLPMGCTYFSLSPAGQMV